MLQLLLSTAYSPGSEIVPADGHHMMQSALTSIIQKSPDVCAVLCGRSDAMTLAVSSAHTLPALIYALHHLENTIQPCHYLQCLSHPDRLAVLMECVNRECESYVGYTSHQYIRKTRAEAGLQLKILPKEERMMVKRGRRLATIWQEVQSADYTNIQEYWSMINAELSPSAKSDLAKQIVEFASELLRAAAGRLGITDVTHTEPEVYTSEELALLLAQPNLGMDLHCPQAQHVMRIAHSRRTLAEYRGQMPLSIRIKDPQEYIRSMCLQIAQFTAVHYGADQIWVIRRAMQQLALLKHVSKDDPLFIAAMAELNNVYSQKTIHLTRFWLSLCCRNIQVATHAIVPVLNILDDIQATLAGLKGGGQECRIQKERGVFDTTLINLFNKQDHTLLGNVCNILEQVGDLIWAWQQTEDVLHQFERYIADLNRLLFKSEEQWTHPIVDETSYIAFATYLTIYIHYMPYVSAMSPVTSNVVASLKRFMVTKESPDLSKVSTLEDSRALNGLGPIIPMSALQDRPMGGMTRSDAIEDDRA